MTLNELAAGLVQNGILVLCISEGKVTDFLTSGAAQRTVVFQNSGRLSSYVLDDRDRIVNADTLKAAVKVLHE